MCEARTHHLVGMYAGAGLAWTTHAPLWHLPIAVGVASLFAGGRLSPDVDQYKAWRRLDKWLPDELLGHGGPLGHRRVSHFWGIPAVVGAALLVTHVLHPGPAWIAWAWLAVGSAVAGWASHLAADYAFGKACWQDGRGAGIPFAPWWAHHGLGFDSGGILERRILVPVLAVAGPATLAWPYAGPLVRTATTAWEATR
jgi:hypothetical protein